jgi:hypothetical protein
MMSPCRAACAAIAAIIANGAGAQAASAAPGFEVAYRAWDVVTEIARHNQDPSISGECGKTFRAYVIPGLRRQSKQEQDLAAVACYQAARSACANGKLRRTADIGRKCEEFP